MGFDVDPYKIESASVRFPSHRFSTHWPEGDEFNTVVALAVIEHVQDPKEFLHRLERVLARLESQIVLTTPHPRFRRVHEAGAALGLFSKEAAAEHRAFLDHRTMKELAQPSGLFVAAAKPFLFGANQLFVLKRH